MHFLKSFGTLWSLGTESVLGTPVKVENSYTKEKSLSKQMLSAFAFGYGVLFSSSLQMVKSGILKT